jgi:origin recognition complex subunit 6
MSGSSVVLMETIKGLGVPLSSALVDKTKELLRLLQNKCPSGSLGKGEGCRNILAIDIACRITNTPIDQSILLNLSRVSSSEYQKLLNTCKTVLNVSWATTSVVDILALQYSREVAEDVTSLLKEYNDKYVMKLHKNVRAYIKLDQPLYQAAAFFVLATSNKVGSYHTFHAHMVN